MRSTGNPRADAFLAEYEALCQKHGVMLYTVGGSLPNRIGLMYSSERFDTLYWYVDSTVTSPATETKGGSRAGASAEVNVITPEKANG